MRKANCQLPLLGMALAVLSLSLSLSGCTDSHAVLEVSPLTYRYNNASYTTALLLINDLVETHKTRIVILQCPETPIERIADFIKMLQHSASFNISVWPSPEACTP